MKKVAIIILNWNGLEDTLECLSSLTRLQYSEYQVIVIDNHSDEDLSALLQHYPDVLLISNQHNYGFCKGNNIGIEKAAEMGLEYCWILNNDTEVDPDSLGRLVVVLDSDQTIAAATNRIGYYADRSLSWFAGGVFKNGLPAHRGFFEAVEDDNHSATTEYLAGCSFLARTKVLQKIGGFDENYFCYVEDVDLSLRIRALGLRITYVRDALIWHKVSRSTGIYSPVKLYYKHRNMLYFLKKFNRPKSTAIRWWLSSLRFIVSLIVKHRNPKAAWYLSRGLFDAVRGQMGPLQVKGI